MFTDSIKKYFPDQKVTLFYGMLGDKQVDDSIKLLCSVAKKVYTLTPDDPSRAISSEAMAEKIRELSPGMEVDFMDSYDEIPAKLDLSKKDEIYAFTGSLYMIGTARTVINEYLAKQK